MMRVCDEVLKDGGGRSKVDDDDDDCGGGEGANIKK